MILESTHVATSIERAASDVYDFVVDPRNLPSWAAGLAQGTVEQVDGHWVAESPMGRVTVSFAPANPFGVADHEVTLPTGEVVANPVRVIPNGDGCDVVFTIHRRAGVTAEAFAADARAVTTDLATLRRILEEA